MPRPTTRTESITPETIEQLEELLVEEHRDYKQFHARYLPHTSYQMFRLALRREDSSPELLQAIDVALDEAQREQIRNKRKTCPHCSKPLE